MNESKPVKSGSVVSCRVAAGPAVTLPCAGWLARVNVIASPSSSAHRDASGRSVVVPLATVAEPWTQCGAVFHASSTVTSTGTSVLPTTLDARRVNWSAPLAPALAV